MKSISNPSPAGMSCYQNRWLERGALASEARSGVLQCKTATPTNAYAYSWHERRAVMYAVPARSIHMPLESITSINPR